ncbi:MAG TPA: hypothetical protein VKC60_12965 [Opitutaceae bacterium]|nr:hypothetical protein [Opitutaceae bacterium]
MLELKQEISRLSLKERRELNAYMIRLRHNTSAWKKTVSKRMHEMGQGKKISVDISISVPRPRAEPTERTRAKAQRRKVRQLIS